MRLTFNEQKKCWILHVDDTINGRRKRQTIALPYGWSRERASLFADDFARSNGISRRKARRGPTVILIRLNYVPGAR